MDALYRQLLAQRLNKTHDKFHGYSRGTASWEEDAGDLLDEVFSANPIGSETLLEDLVSALELLEKVIGAGCFDDVSSALDDNPISISDVRQMLGHVCGSPAGIVPGVIRAKRT